MSKEKKTLSIVGKMLLVSWLLLTVCPSVWAEETESAPAVESNAQGNAPPAPSLANTTGTLDLQTCVRLADGAHPAIGPARARLEQAEAMIAEAHAHLFPVVEYDIGGRQFTDDLGLEDYKMTMRNISIDEDLPPELPSVPENTGDQE